MQHPDQPMYRNEEGVVRLQNLTDKNFVIIQLQDLLEEMTRKVAEFLNIDNASAEKVVDLMYIGGFDFSESSYESIESEAKRVLSYLKDRG